MGGAEAPSQDRAVQPPGHQRARPCTLNSLLQRGVRIKVGSSAGKDLIFMVPEAGGHSLARCSRFGLDEPVGMVGGLRRKIYRSAVVRL